MNFLCRVGLAENEISDAPLPHRKQGTFLAFDFSQTQLEFPLTVYGSFIFILFTELAWSDSTDSLAYEFYLGVVIMRCLLDS